MMAVLSILFSLSAFTGAGEVPQLSEIRQLYKKAATAESSCIRLIDVLPETAIQARPLFKGYKAAGTMMMANYVINPFSKLSYFKKGRKMLQQAIDTDKQNLELKFLRFTIQTNIPSFLGYSDHIKTDKETLISKVEMVNDAELKNMILSYLLASNTLTENEKLRISTISKK